MDNREHPSKSVLIAAILPLIVALVCIFIFVYLGMAQGAVISIIALIAYYVIFGIFYAVASLKHDEAQREIDKAASTSLKVGTVFLIIFTVLTVAGAFVSFAFDQIPIGLACAGAFVLGVIIFVLIIVFSSRVRKTPPKSATKRGEGVCTACVPCISVFFLSGFVKVGRKIFPKYGGKSTYKIIVEIDGKPFTVHSHSDYAIGERVQIAYADGKNKGYLIQNSDG